MKILKTKAVKLNESSFTDDTDRMTVKELKELLNKYADDLIVEVKGGEGGWSELRVGTLEIETGTNRYGKTYEYTEFNPIATLMVGA